MNNLFLIFLGQAVQQTQNEGSTKRKADRPTRVRTVLNEKQLHTLRTCYNANPRPDAMMKEQLVEMTGLSPRVIRVWFQNKRCKDKKKATFILKSQNPNQQQNTDDLQVKKWLCALHFVYNSSYISLILKRNFHSKLLRKLPIKRTRVAVFVCA